MITKDEIIKNLRKGLKCPKDCVCHKFETHNSCLTCKALKNSPYHKDYLKDKTDEEIAEEIISVLEEECEEIRQ